jgi:uroporphyrinogen-III decarboxylase
MAGMDTKELKREFGGGFVFSPVHNVQTGVPPENVVAMFETAREYGVYHS